MDSLQFSVWNSLLEQCRLKFSRLENIFPKLNNNSNKEWSELQTDVSELILKKLALVEIFRFRAVCSSWKIAAESYISSQSYNPSRKTPWLMLGMDKHNDPFYLFNLTESKCYRVRSIFKFYYRRFWCLGSSDGWLLLFQETGETHLVNPFSGAEIQLPWMSTLVKYENMMSHDDVGGKAVFSSDPCRSNNFSVAFMYSDHKWPHRLAFCDCGDESWRLTSMKHQCYADVICYKDNVYAISPTRAVVDIWDILSQFPKKVVDYVTPRVSRSLLDQWGWLPLRNHVQIICQMTTLVKSMGEILVVDRIMVANNFWSTIGFSVSKLDCGGERNRTLPVQTLPDLALFVGPLSAASVSTQDCPELEPNSIYFVDHDCLGVYDLKQRKINRNRHAMWKNIGYSTAWVIPNPW
ncbi:hypothetical protein FNV43_RR01340 [Rhamnella rubrinervis]|uniref:F-box protein n=1 Tax=Rhamnella rubrinervis TaxID=2594499 RepID=A0A8K0HQ84_9ROSA|nr:hypothetical protein FNV43_RR01340 [Rhamnella rubrinervis]